MQDNQLNKYFTSETLEVWRSEINLANYNPRKISDEARRKLKQNIKKNGIIGGLIWNKQTGILVSGHQRVSILDELNKYTGTKETDYRLKVEVIDVDEKTEKELNIWFNNTSVQGEYDYNLLAELIPDIDYKSAGLTESDLSMIGVDYLFQTDEENNIASDLDDLMSNTREQNRLEKEARKQSVKDMKERIKQQAEEKAGNLDAYVMISFDTFKAKASFCKRFGYHVNEKFIKGEIFSEMIERID